MIFFCHDPSRVYVTPLSCSPISCEGGEKSVLTEQEGLTFLIHSQSKETLQGILRGLFLGSVILFRYSFIIL